MTRTCVLGVPIDVLTMETAVATMQELCMRETGCAHVMTPNSEMLVEAVRNPSFHAVLCSANLAIPDSAGIAWAMRYCGSADARRVPGVDAFAAFCRTLDASVPVFFLGAEEGVAERAATMLQRQNPSLCIAGTYAGTPSDPDAPEILKRIRSSGARVLLVAYGAPQQDLWIHRHMSALPAVRLAAGVGGSFDFWAGRQVRSPMWMRRMGLEWCWRLFKQPKRLPRIFRAVVVFPLLVLRNSAPRIDAPDDDSVQSLGV